MERLTVDYGKKFSPFRYAMKDGDEVGKAVFLTQEEAEQKLKEMDGD